MLRIFVLFLSLFAAQAFADTYQLSVSWTDPTPTGANYTPAYDVEYQVGAATVVQAYNNATPSFSVQIVTAPGTQVQARARNKNTQGPLLGNWTPFIVASAPAGPTSPSDPVGFTFTVNRVGP